MCGEVFQRVIVDRNCEFRIHSVQTTFKGDSSFKKKRSEATAKSAEQTEAKMCEIYNNSATRRGKKETNWQHIIDNGDDEPSMNAKQFLDMGLCDEIL